MMSVSICQQPIETTTVVFTSWSWLEHVVCLFVEPCQTTTVAGYGCTNRYSLVVIVYCCVGSESDDIGDPLNHIERPPH